MTWNRKRLNYGNMANPCHNHDLNAPKISKTHTDAVEWFPKAPGAGWGMSRAESSGQFPRNVFKSHNLSGKQRKPNT